MIRIPIALVALGFAVPAYAVDAKPVERRDFDKKNPLDNEFLAVASALQLSVQHGRAG